MSAGVEVLLVRHGLPNRVEGVKRPDPGLTAVGAAQASAVADMLVHLPVRAIASSDLRRACETAAPSADRFGFDVAVDPELAEMDLGEDYYIPIEDMVAERDPRLDEWRALMANGAMSTAVTEFRQQATTAVLRAARSVGEGTIAVFCHGGVISACVAKAMGDYQPSVADAEYGSATRIHIGTDDSWKLRTYNEIHHLERAASPRRTV